MIFGNVRIRKDDVQRVRAWMRREWAPGCIIVDDDGATMVRGIITDCDVARLLAMSRKWKRRAA